MLFMGMLKQINTAKLRGNVRLAGRRLARFDQLIEEARFGNTRTATASSNKRRAGSKKGLPEVGQPGGNSGTGIRPLDKAENPDIAT
jgi:hypothetical protein